MDSTEVKCMKRKESGREGSVLTGAKSNMGNTAGFCESA